jgi:hypothetical protein
LKAIVNAKVVAKNSTFIVTHKDQELHFSFQIFTRTSGTEDLTFHLNEYWQYLSEDKQDKIFEIYSNILKHFSSIYDKRTFIDVVSTEISELLSYHKPEDIYNWIIFSSNITVPSSIQNEYVADINTNNTREKTYLVRDYIELLALAISLRSVVPIWGEFILNFKDDLGTNFKEIQAFTLLNKSDILEYSAMRKLKLYIENIVGDAKYELASITSGISSEDYFDYLLALVCIRKVCVEDIHYDSADKNLVICVHSYINNKLSNLNKGGVNEITDKRKESSNNTSDINNLSVLERYRVKTPLPPGEVIELEFVMRDIPKLATRLTEGNIDPVLLHRSIETASKLREFVIEEPQITLLQWIFKPVISPRGIWYLNKNIVINALGALEAILWARGFKYLAILSSAYRFVSEDGFHMSQIESKLRVPDELVAEINRLYPFSIQHGLKKYQNKPINTVEKAINSVVEKLSSKTWLATAHEDMLMEVFGSISRKIPIKHDIRIEMYKLVISIAKRES